MSEIKPALTPEEWADIPDMYSICVEWDGYEHMIAAVALHNQPFGFTREDVDRMKWLESGEETCPKCGGSSWKLPARPICTGCGWRPHESSEDLVDRIGALLSPEGQA